MKIFLAIVLLVAGFLSWIGRARVMDYTDPKPHAISAIYGIKLGDKLSDLASRYKIEPSDVLDNAPDSVQYKVTNTEIFLVVDNRTKSISELIQYCGYNAGTLHDGYSSFADNYNGIGCGADSGMILSKYSRKNVRIFCKSGDAKGGYRFYSVPDYGVRYGLHSDRVEFFYVSSVRDLKSFKDPNWKSCD